MDVQRRRWALLQLLWLGVLFRAMVAQFTIAMFTAACLLVFMFNVGMIQRLRLKKSPASAVRIPGMCFAFFAGWRHWLTDGATTDPLFMLYFVDTACANLAGFMAAMLSNRLEGSTVQGSLIKGDGLWYAGPVVMLHSSCCLVRPLAYVHACSTSVIWLTIGIVWLAACGCLSAVRADKRKYALLVQSFDSMSHLVDFVGVVFAWLKQPMPREHGHQVWNVVEIISHHYPYYFKSSDASSQASMTDGWAMAFSATFVFNIVIGGRRVRFAQPL